jgi:hypothetical protein
MKNYNDKVVGTNSAYTNPSYIEPGQKAHYEITEMAENVMGGDLDVVDHYAVHVNSSS